MNQLRWIAKQLAFLVLGSGLTLRFKMQAISRTNSLTILNFHRINNNDLSAYTPLDPKIFKTLLIFLLKHFYITSFAELLDFLPSSQKTKKPMLILSFDDGYRDFAEVAIPLLENHKIRANQNIIPWSVETGLPPLNVRMQDFIGRAPIVLLKTIIIHNLSFSISDFNGDRIRFGNKLSSFIKNRSMQEQNFLYDNYLKQLFDELNDFSSTPMLNKNDIKSLVDCHDIGLHSFEHASMAYETDEYLRNDLIKCFEYFQNNFESYPLTYAFPNGSCRVGQLKIAEDSNFRWILHVDNKFNKSPDCHLYRFGVDATSNNEAFFKATGGLNWPIK
jgi:peptidoglycan/xylan/chitin deacetylase (PgdA/CDA1 family)